MRFRSEKARVKAHQARIEELREQLKEIELHIRAESKEARIQFEKARERFELVSSAVEAAGKTLNAEKERFRLGEGRSRNVLDAQRDMTQAIQRQMRIAADLLRAKALFAFATGYAFENHTKE